jgi:heme-degrading monooxygenase HmoA
MLAAVPGIASFHLVRHASAVRTLARLGTDRVALRRVPGLRFVRLLGTGAGDSTGPGADLRRSAMFAVWDDEAALDAFERSMAPRWAAAEEAWHVRLRSAGGHGAWRGVPVLDLLEPAHRADGPLAFITRADVHLRSWRAFRAAGDPVSQELHGADGLLAVVGVGEAPVGRLGTFSLWRDLAAARAFAEGLPRHREVVARTRREQWYGEELFARFEPYASSGTWDGRDPLRVDRDSTGTSIP